MNTRCLAPVLLVGAVLFSSGCRREERQEPQTAPNQTAQTQVQTQTVQHSDGAAGTSPVPGIATGPQRWTLKAIKGRDGDVVELQVFKSGETVPYQRLTGFSAQPLDDLVNGKLVDLNCDGKNDIMLMEFLPAGPNVPYLYWIYNPQSNRFECTPPEGQSSCSFQFPDPVDCETKQLVTNERDSATTYVVRHWGWQGTQLVIVKETQTELRENGQKTVTVKERQDGKLRQTSQSVE